MGTTAWVDEELESVDIGDKRLNDRLGQVLSQLGGHPTASIPASCGGRAEMVAAYRFFDNESVTFEKVLEPHIEATRKRLAEHDTVVVAQDTTQLDLTRPDSRVQGAGPLDVSTRRGALLHPLHAFTPDGTPLGTLDAIVWTREDDAPSVSTQTRNERQHVPIEDKESIRWLDMMRTARQEAQTRPQTQIVCVADSEADIYELFEADDDEPANFFWLVRACQNRALQSNAGRASTEVDDPGKYMRERAMNSDVLFTQTLQVRGRKAKVAADTRQRKQPRQARQAEVEVRAVPVTLRAPRRYDRKLTDATVHVVLVSEIDPPANDVPVEWMLLTTLPIDTHDQVATVIRYYCVRWMIEVFFRTLKSGCRVEERRFEHIDRLLPCLAVYMIVTWRTLYVCRLGREFPDIDCDAVFEPEEWKGTYYFLEREPPPKHPPTLATMVRMVAQLGGYVNKKRPDPPGPQTVWLGLQRVHDIANCWLAFGPESKAPT